MRIYEEAAHASGLPVEQLRQTLMLTAMGYSQTDIARSLQVHTDVVKQLQDALDEVSHLKGIDEASQKGMAAYLVTAEFVGDELMELYMDQKADYQAQRQRLTSHPDGRAVRKVAVRDMVGTLTSITGMSKDRLAVSLSTHRIREAALKKPSNVLPGGEAFDPASLVEAIDVPFTVESEK